MWIFLPYGIEYNDEIYSIAGEADNYNEPTRGHKTKEGAEREKWEYIQKSIGGENLRYYTYDEISEELIDFVHKIGGDTSEEDWVVRVPKDITIPQTEELMKLINDELPFFPIDGRIIELKEVDETPKRNGPLESEIDNFNEVKKALTEKVENNLWDIFKEVFEIGDDIDSFAFPAYTPYWMDGETCEYSVYDVYFVNEEYLEDLEWYDYTSSKNNNMKALDLANSLIAKLPDDIIKMSFGDHKLITISRGKSVHIHEYQHD